MELEQESTPSKSRTRRRVVVSRERLSDGQSGSGTDEVIMRMLRGRRRAGFEKKAIGVLDEILEEVRFLRGEVRHLKNLQAGESQR